MTEDKDKSKARYRVKKEKTDQEILDEKLNNHVMTSADIKAIFYLDKEAFEARMNRLCELYPDIEPSMFKEGKYYRFQPEWQAIFLTLFGAVENHPEYHRDVTKRKFTLEGKSGYFSSIKENMHRFMTAKDNKFYENHPAYIRAELEKKLIEKINEQIYQSSFFVEMMPDDLRFRFLAGICISLEEWNLKINKESMSRKIKSHLDARGLSEKEKHEMRACQSPLDQMLVNKLKIGVTETCEGTVKNDEDSIEQGEYIKALLRELAIDPHIESKGSEMRKIAENIRKEILDRQSNAELIHMLLKKIEGIDDNRKEIIKEALEQIVVVLELADEKSSKVRNKLRRECIDLNMHNAILTKFAKSSRGRNFSGRYEDDEDDEDELDDEVDE